MVQKLFLHPFSVQDHHISKSCTDCSQNIHCLHRAMIFPSYLNFGVWPHTYKLKEMCLKCHPFIPEFTCVRYFGTINFLKSSIYKCAVWIWKAHNSLKFYITSSKKLNVSKYPVCKQDKTLKMEKRKSYIFSCTHLTVQQLQGGKHVMQTLA